MHAPPPERRAAVPYVAPPPYAGPAQRRGPWPAPYAVFPQPLEAPPAAPAAGLRFGTVGAGVAGAGALLLLVALVFLPWYSLDGGLDTGEVRERLAATGALASDLSIAYFTWLAPVLVAVTLGFALIAALPRPRLSPAFRIAGPIAAGFAALFTLDAAQLVDTAYGDDTFYLAHLSTGFWCALLGYVWIGAGAVIGPRRAGDASRRVDGPVHGATFGK